MCSIIIAREHGLQPALVMDSGRIFVGIKLAPVDFNRCEMSKYAVVISKASKNAPFVCHTGRYLMAELTGEGDISERVESAHKHLSKGFGDDICIPEMEEEKAALAEEYVMDVVG